MDHQNHETMTHVDACVEPSVKLMVNAGVVEPVGPAT